MYRANGSVAVFTSHSSTPQVGAYCGPGHARGCGCARGGADCALGGGACMGSLAPWAGGAAVPVAGAVSTPDSGRGLSELQDPNSAKMTAMRTMLVASRPKTAPRANVVDRTYIAESTCSSSL